MVDSLSMQDLRRSHIEIRQQEIVAEEAERANSYQERLTDSTNAKVAMCCSRPFSCMKAIDRHPSRPSHRRWIRVSQDHSQVLVSASARSILSIGRMFHEQLIRGVNA